MPLNTRCRVPCPPMAGRVAGFWEYAISSVGLYGSTQRRQMLYLLPFCFIYHCVCDSVVVKHLVGSPTSTAGEDKMQDSQGGRPCNFWTSIWLSRLKCILWKKNENNSRLLKRDRGRQVAFGIGKALISKLEAEITVKAAQPVFFPC